MTDELITRLLLPARRIFDDAKPLLHYPRFGVQVRAKTVAREHFPARRVLVEFLPPRRISPDILTVQCVVDDVRFELIREGQRITPVVTHLEKAAGQIVGAMKQLPSIALGMLVFDHRARCSTTEAVALVGLIDAFAPRANEQKFGETNSSVRDAELALEEVFGAAARWMENGYE